jgi:hypothetical protein
MYDLDAISTNAVPSLPTSDEESKDKMNEWTTVEANHSLSEEDDKIFHPDDEIIDPKDTVDVSVKRVCPSLQR